MADIVVFDGQLGIVSVVADPKPSNRTLAFIPHLLICCRPMLGNQVAHVAELADALDSGSSE